MWRILRKTIQVAIILGTVSCFVAAGVVYFGLRFDKHEFIHSEISMLSIFIKWLKTFSHSIRPYCPLMLYKS